MDLDISIFKKSKTGIENISSQEAFNIWDTLRARYDSAETIQFFSNFIHDRDFDMLLNNHLNNIQTQINKLENMAQKYKIKTPSAPSHEITISAKLDQINDKFIFRKIYGSFIHELFALSRSVTTSTFNDKVRKIFINFLMSHLQDYKTFYENGKLKGWTEIPPAYKTYKSVKKEQLSESEAAHIWDHINMRYDQLQLTKIYSQFIHDLEFEKILNRGETILKKQVKILEKKSSQFEVPVPENPPAVIESPIDPEIMEDKFAYRRIFKGLQEAIDLHIRAVVESIRNDSLRDLFFDFLQEELDLYDAFLKYGKVKGWSHISPKHKNM